jgi:branched-chain amino acid transport system substrate-binding protein
MTRVIRTRLFFRSLSMSFARPARWTTAIACASALLIAGCGQSVPSTILIGVAQPLSGPSAARGKDLVDGVKLAAAELNESNFIVGGKQVKFEIVVVDDKAEKETAKKVAEELVKQKVVAVIGHLNSDITEATIPIYKAGNVPQLFTSSADELTKLGDGNAFRLVASDALQARAVAGYVDEVLKAGNIAIIAEDTAFGRPMAKDVTDALGKRNKPIALNAVVKGNVTDFADFVAKMKTTPPGVLIAVLRDNQLLPLFEQMAAAGLSDVPVIATSVARTDKLATAPVKINSLFVTSGALEASEFAAGQQFLKKFRNAYNAEPVWAAHYAYDATYMLADMIRRANSVDAAQLRAKLRTSDGNAPVTSSMRFTEAGEQAYGAVAVYRRRAGRWDLLMRSDRW